MRKIIMAVAAALTLAGCGEGVKIKGHLVCSGQAETIYLDMLSPTGMSTADSVSTTDGKFKFKVTLGDGQQAIYNLRCGGHVIPLLLSPGERVTVKGFGNVSRNYTVKGSEGSALMRELAMVLNNGAARLDSLTNIYVRLAEADTMRRHVTREYTRSYFDIKREQIRFIVSNAGSLAALYGLYQRLPNDPTLFNGNPTDVVYYRVVADSLSQTQPSSPYLPSLRADISRMEGLDPGKVQEISYPDLDMPDMYGKRHRLSDMQGKVVLIDFWSASLPKCNLNNAELKELYARYNGQGFEVYQVSVDSSKPDWINAVQGQKLPWTSVNDLKGQSSQGVRQYNVGGVPTNFLLDRQGNIVGKDLYGDKLAAKVASLL